jgi:hypothetical protein
MERDTCRVTVSTPEGVFGLVHIRGEDVPAGAYRPARSRVYGRVTGG